MTRPPRLYGPGAVEDRSAPAAMAFTMAIAGLVLWPLGLLVVLIGWDVCKPSRYEHVKGRALGAAAVTLGLLETVAVAVAAIAWITHWWR
jgi:hypothetical protein